MQPAYFAEKYFNEVQIQLFDKTIANGSVFATINGFAGNLMRKMNSLHDKLEKYAIGEFERNELMIPENETTNKNEFGIHADVFAFEPAPAENGNLAEVFVADPFCTYSSTIGKYDGNPSTPFGSWLEKFTDVLSLASPELDEKQKLVHLRFFLSGHPRTIFDQIQPVPTTLDAAINCLKNVFENGNAKAIARETLSKCKQCNGEPVFDFANRLVNAIRAAMAGEEEEEEEQKRLHEEFQDRLVPELAFHVKGERTTTYSASFESAQHWELLLQTCNQSSRIAVADLTAKMDQLPMREATSNCDRNTNRRMYGNYGDTSRDSSASSRNSRNCDYRQSGRISPYIRAANPVVTETNKCDEKMQIHANLNGIRTCCLIDTGAYASIMSINLCAKLGIRDFTTHKHEGVKGIGNKFIPVKGETKVKLQMAGCNIYTTFIVVENEFSPNNGYECIIGRETLDQLPLCLNFQTRKLFKIHPRNVPKTISKWPKICYKCRKPGHKIANCPELINKNVSMDKYNNLRREILTRSTSCM